MFRQELNNLAALSKSLPARLLLSNMLIHTSHLCVNVRGFVGVQSLYVGLIYFLSKLC